MDTFYITRLYMTGPDKIESLISFRYEKSIQFYNYDDHMLDILNYSEYLTYSCLYIVFFNLLGKTCLQN